MVKVLLLSFFLVILIIPSMVYAEIWWDNILKVKLTNTNFTINTNSINTTVYEWNGSANSDLDMNNFSIFDANYINGTTFCMGSVCKTIWPTTFPGFTNLATDYGFTDNSANWNTAFGWGDYKANNSLNSWFTNYTAYNPFWSNHTATIINYLSGNPQNYYNASSNITEITNNLYVPYVGANTFIDLGNQNITTTAWLGNNTHRVGKGWFTDLEVTNAIVGNLIPLSASSGTLIKNYAGATVATFGLGGASSTNIGLLGPTAVTGNCSATYFNGPLYGYIANNTERNLFTNTTNNTYDKFVTLNASSISNNSLFLNGNNSEFFNYRTNTTINNVIATAILNNTAGNITKLNVTNWLIIGNICIIGNTTCYNGCTPCTRNTTDNSTCIITYSTGGFSAQC